MSNTKKIAAKRAVKVAAHKAARRLAAPKLIHYISVSYASPEGIDSEVDAEIKHAVGCKGVFTGCGYFFIDGRRDLSFDFKTKAAMNDRLITLKVLCSQRKKLKMKAVAITYEDE